MKIPVKDFTVVPVLCPIGLKDCSPCKYAKFTEVRNPPIVSGKHSFGYVDCSRVEKFDKELAEAIEKEGIK